MLAKKQVNAFMLLHILTVLSLALQSKSAILNKSTSNSGQRIQLDHGKRQTCLHVWQTKNSSETARVCWKSGNHIFSQVLDFPKWMWPYDESDLPKAAGIWNTDRRYYLWILGKEQSGTWEIKDCVIYRLDHEKWKRLVWKNPNQMSFSNRGTFFIKDNTLNIVDFIYDENYAHFAPAHYQLRRFRLRNGELKLLSIRTTTQRYESITLDEDGYVGDRNPLREFGLKWRQWDE